MSTSNVQPHVPERRQAGGSRPLPTPRKVASGSGEKAILSKVCRAPMGKREALLESRPSSLLLHTHINVSGTSVHFHRRIRGTRNRILCSKAHLRVLKSVVAPAGLESVVQMKLLFKWD